MREKYIYLDNAATTAVRGEVLSAMLPYFGDIYGNPSSQHRKGRDAFQAIDIARGQVARAVGAKSKSEIYFTGCGSEADAWAIRGAAYARKDKGRHLVTTAIEHPAVLRNIEQLEKEGFKVTYLGVDSDGIISLSELEKAICSETTLISIMAANNEIGSIQPISEIGKIARSKGILFHTDAVQAIGCVDLDVEKMNVDLLAVSAHKFYAPKGIGCLYIRNGVKIDRFLIGGGQERTMRAGTHNVPSIVAMGKAIELAVAEREQNNERLIKMRDKLIGEIESKIPDVVLNGSRENRLANNVNFSFKYVEAEAILLMLDMRGIGVSSGSACSSGTLKQSHVLAAIGRETGISQGTVRFTFGKFNEESDIDYVVSSVAQVVEKLRSMSPLKKGE